MQAVMSYSFIGGHSALRLGEGAFVEVGEGSRTQTRKPHQEGIKGNARTPRLNDLAA